MHKNSLHLPQKATLNYVKFTSGKCRLCLKVQRFYSTPEAGYFYMHEIPTTKLGS